MNTVDRNKGGTGTGGKEVTVVKALGKKNNLDFTPLAINPHFSNGRNQRQCSLATVMMVFGVRVRHTWFKPLALSLIL